jgi:hypothetical protein
MEKGIKGAKYYTGLVMLLLNYIRIRSHIWSLTEVAWGWLESLFSPLISMDVVNAPWVMGPPFLCCDGKFQQKKNVAYCIRVQVVVRPGN